MKKRFPHDKLNISALKLDRYVISWCLLITQTTSAVQDDCFVVLLLLVSMFVLPVL